MTMLQIQAMLMRADIREHNEYSAQAALHNKKVRPRSMRSLTAWDDAQNLSKQGDVDYDKIEGDMSQIMQEIKDGSKTR